MQKIQDDEIDLFKILQTLWVRKWLIIAFTLIAMLIGSGYIYNTKPTYESQFTYSIDNLPPFYNSSKVLADFRKQFYSKNTFDNWKKNIGKTSLVFEDFSNTKDVNGFVMAKPHNQQLATIKSIRTQKNSKLIIVKTNQLAILEDFFKYANFLSKYLNKEYVERAENELKIMEIRYKDLSSSSIFETVLSIERYVVTAKKQSNLFSISHPTIPKKISPKSRIILLLSLILGGIIGVSYVLISNFISNRKE